MNRFRSNDKIIRSFNSEYQFLSFFVVISSHGFAIGRPGLSAGRAACQASSHLTPAVAPPVPPHQVAREGSLLGVFTLPGGTCAEPAEASLAQSGLQNRRKFFLPHRLRHEEGGILGHP